MPRPRLYTFAPSTGVVIFRLYEFFSFNVYKIHLWRKQQSAQSTTRAAQPLTILLDQVRQSSASLMQASGAQRQHQEVV